MKKLTLLVVILLIAVLLMGTTKYRDLLVVSSTITASSITSSTIDSATTYGRLAYGSIGTTCPTGSSSYSTCPSFVPFNQTFPDTNYNVACSGVGPSDGRATMDVNSKSTNGVTILVHTMGSVSVSYAAVNCIAIHN